jgi:Zn-dependent protease with chaperone function
MTSAAARCRARWISRSLAAALAVVAGLLAAGAVELVVTVQRQACARGVTWAGCLRLDPAALLALAFCGLALLVCGLAALSLARQLLAERRLLASLAATSGAPLGRHVRLVESDTPVAFCAGVVRPRVYVSAGMLALLEEDQLAAVLAHEEQHRRARDPLKLAVARVVDRALFFLPALRRLGAAYATAAELGADEAAVEACRGRCSPLASALLALGGVGGSGGLAVEAERIDHLMGRAADRAVSRRSALVGLASVIGLALGAVAVSWVAASSGLDRVELLSQLPLFALVLAAGCGVALARRRSQPA